MPSYGETIGEQLQRMRLGPTIIRRGKLPKGPSKPMASTAFHIGIADGPSGRVAAGLGDATTVAIPADVLADRDRRMAMEPRSFGDPLPGQSAFDKRQGAQ